MPTSARGRVDAWVEVGVVDCDPDRGPAGDLQSAQCAALKRLIDGLADDADMPTTSRRARY